MLVCKIYNIFEKEEKGNIWYQNLAYVDQIQKVRLDYYGTVYVCTLLLFFCDKY